MPDRYPGCIAKVLDARLLTARSCPAHLELFYSLAFASYAAFHCVDDLCRPGMREEDSLPMRDYIKGQKSIETMLSQSRAEMTVQTPRTQSRQQCKHSASRTAKLGMADDDLLFGRLFVEHILSSEVQLFFNSVGDAERSNEHRVNTRVYK